jgi:hypothetical protein
VDLKRWTSEGFGRKATPNTGLCCPTGACDRLASWELFALRWRDFDDLTATVSVRQAVYDKVFDVPKTEKSRHVMPLSRLTTAFLCDWRSKLSHTEPADFIIQVGSLRLVIKNAC